MGVTSYLLIGFYTSFQVILYIEGVDENPITKINGGYEATENQFPYQVSLQFQNIHICGGGIISDLFILTAAHCVIDSDNREFIDKLMTVVIGTVELTNPSTTSLRIEIELMYVPAKYNPQVMKTFTVRPEGDIAMIKLRKPIGLLNHPHLKKLELPKEPYSNYVGEKATIAGFGYDWMKMIQEQCKNENPLIKLRYAEAKVISNAECASVMVREVLVSNLCARVVRRDQNKPQGLCNGDSGGSLVHENNVVIGIVSSSPTSCDETVGAGVYTRVTSYIDFINNALAGKKTRDMRLATWHMFNELYPGENYPPVLLES